MMQLFSSSSVFLFLTHEGAGMVVPEAMSYGCPCCAGIIAVRVNLFTPLLNSPFRTDRIEKALKTMRKIYTGCIIDQLFYQQESLFATERYDALFNWDIKGDQLDNIYSSITATKK